MKYFDITNVALEISQVNSPSEFRALFACHNMGISHAFRAEMPWIKSNEHIRLFQEHLTNAYFVVNSTEIAWFSSQEFITGSSSQKKVIKRDRKQCADMRSKKHGFSYTLLMIFDRLSRHLWFLKFGASFRPSQQSRFPISMTTTHGRAVILCMNFLLHGKDGRMLKLLKVGLREDCKANFGGNVLQGWEKNNMRCFC